MTHAVSPAVGRYEPDASLAVGAMCEVFRGRDAHGHPVVIKRLHRHCAADSSLVEMFLHEARVMSVMEHPNVTRVLDHGFDGDRWILVQGHIAGVDLGSRPPSHPEERLHSGIAVVRQLLAALHHAHTRTDASGAPLSIVHRDVAPSNVIVGPDGHVTLVDWGLATSTWRPDPDHGRMKGTRGYMAPEVVTGECVADARSDLFGVGVILYELTVGRRLYAGGPLEVMMAIADGPTPSPRQEVPGYPVALDAVVQRALARDVAERYQTAAEMAAALEASVQTL